MSIIILDKERREKMKASELIEKIAHNIALYGDKEIKVVANSSIINYGEIFDVEYDIETNTINIY